MANSQTSNSMHSTSEVGKHRRLSRLFDARSGHMLMVPLDEGLIGGPVGGLADMQHMLGSICNGGANAVLGYSGLFKSYGNILENLGWVVNLTASTRQSSHTRKVQVTNVIEAVRLGAEAVAVHVNISSKYESEMLMTLGAVSQECHDHGLPLLAIMYPRSEGDGKDENYDQLRAKDHDKYVDLIAHSARIGMELGADIIKTQYTGTIESFAGVVKCCAPLPIIAAGGVPKDEEMVLETAREIIAAGAAGISFGRNVFTRKHPERMISALRKIVHGNCS